MDTTMLENINFISSLLLVTIGIVVGICLLFILTPDREPLNNYKIAKHIMGFAYISLGVFMIGEMILLPLADIDMNIIRIIILSISSLLALSFTYSLLTLIDIRFFNRQKFIKELIPIGCCSICCFITFIFFRQFAFTLFLLIFVVYYISILIRYTRLFYRTFNTYKKQMDNFFSGQEWKRLSWVNFSFYYALAVGIFALMSILNFNIGFIVFKLFIIPFYIYFGCQLINYGFRFPNIEPALQQDTLPKEQYATEKLSFKDIKPVIEEWIRQKKYLQPGITIGQMASQLNTNRTYLSNYINNTKQQTFRTWINELRIEEAKQLLLQQPALSVSEIGSRVGFTDKSNFGRQFNKLTSVTPQAWRKIHLNK